jgi:CRISPR/Cas system-associated exonuclease Cas4 (RecB family)
MIIKEVLVEKEIQIDDLNVRGYLDLAIVTDDKEVHLFDIKTINDWSYKMKFGRKADPSGSIHQELQLATYGLALEDMYPDHKIKMYLLFYNKNTSMIKYLEVTEDRIMSSYSFWKRTLAEHKNGLPDLKKGVSPVMDWECRYCQYKQQCEGDLNV